MIERERTFLAKYLPQDLEKHPYILMEDRYMPATSNHPKLRLRRKDVKYELTKKEPLNAGDASQLVEQTIILTREEFDALHNLPARTVVKKRYQYPWQGLVAEIDVFEDALRGLVLVDIEFTSVSEKDACPMPDFCLADVTQEDAFAGGMLCGKPYSELQHVLNKYGYNKIL